MTPRYIILNNINVKGMGMWNKKVIPCKARNTTSTTRFIYSEEVVTV